MAAEESPVDPPSQSEDKEALQYWGYLLKDDKCGTEKLNSLLEGIAKYITTTFEPSDCPDLSPSQLAAFYRAVGGNYDILFVDTPPSSVSFIYKSLGCLHSIQPGPTDDGYTTPSIPCLKPRGFVTWQTIQLLLGPEEHGPFLQSAVKLFDIVDPEDGKPFPKVLPKDAFPEKPDQAMLDWYESVSRKLKAEAEAAQALPPNPTRVATLSATDSGAESGDERSEAANYFSNPLYRDPSGRPRIVRRFAPRLPQPTLEGRGRTAAHRVRHFWNPDAARHRRRSLPERDSDDYRDGDVTPTGLHPRYEPRRSSHPHQRRSISQATDSESDGPSPAHRRQPSPRRARSPRREELYRRDKSPRQDSKSRIHSKQSSASNSPTLRHHRSHELPQSPRDYFPPFYENEPRRHSIAPSPDPGGFAPSKTPSMAAQVAAAQLQTSRHSPRQSPRASISEERGAYNGRPTVRYSRNNVEPIDERPYTHAKRTHAREEYERRSRSNDPYGREDDRSPPHRYVEGTKGRRYPVETPWH